MDIPEIFKQLQEQSDADKQRIAELEAVIDSIRQSCGSVTISEKSNAQGILTILKTWGAKIGSLIPSGKTIVWIAVLASAVFLFSDGTITLPDGNGVLPTPPVIKKEEIPMTAKESEIVTSAIEIINADVANNAITDVGTAKQALAAEIPTSVRDAVIAEVKAETIAELPAMLDAVKKKITVK
jgi:hypothetical protein